jgi:probable HAF family extracellular repeat protein
MNAILSVKLAASLLVCAASLPALANRYRIVDLGETSARRLNEASEVAGCTGDEAAIFRNGEWDVLSTGGLSVCALDITDSGYAVGQEWETGVGGHNHLRSKAVMWLPDKTEVVLPMPKHGWSGDAKAISNTGYVTGTYRANYLGRTDDRCFLWTPWGGTINLRPFKPEIHCVARDVNDRGQIVGETYFYDSGPGQAFLWEEGRMRNLGTLGGVSSTANGINEHGEVVGSSATLREESAPEHAFLWRNGVMTDLHDSTDYTNSLAYALNNKGDIVGLEWVRFVGSTSAVRFDKGRVVHLTDEAINLEDWQLTMAYDVNDGGVIVGYGYRSGREHSYMLVPVD